MAGKGERHFGPKAARIPALSPSKTPNFLYFASLRTKIYPPPCKPGDTAFMRIAHPSSLTDHRLARFMTWARLFLVWLAGAFAGFVGDVPRRRLDQVARMVGELMFLHVAARVRPPPTGAHRHGRLSAISQRAAVGSRLRRAMRGKDFAARLVAILGIMRDAEIHIAKLARRLAGGLTRLRVIALAPEPGPHIAPPPLARAVCADTS